MDAENLSKHRSVGVTSDDDCATPKAAEKGCKLLIWEAFSEQFMPLGHWQCHGAVMSVGQETGSLTMRQMTTVRTIRMLTDTIIFARLAEIITLILVVLAQIRYSWSSPLPLQISVRTLNVKAQLFRHCATLKARSNEIKEISSTLRGTDSPANQLDSSLIVLSDSPGAIAPVST